MKSDQAEYNCLTTRGPVLCAADSWQHAKKLIESDGYTVVMVSGKENGKWKPLWKYKASSGPTFRPGTVVTFDPSNFNPAFWDGLSEEDRIKYYGPLGYGAEKLVHFVFLCEIISCPGHCVLVNMDTQQIETMRHTSDFRACTEDEL